MSNFNDTTYAALKLVENALKHAKRKHKNFAATKHEAGNILAEELLEVNGGCVCAKGAGCTAGSTVGRAIGKCLRATGDGVTDAGDLLELVSK